MAADWLPMRVNLADDPHVVAIASALELDEDTVVGKLHRMWAWFDQQTDDGCARSVTKKWLDRYCRCEGWAEAVAAVGWLEIDQHGLRMPEFDRWLGNSGKKRIQAARRMQKLRGERNECDAESVTKAQPQNRTEQNNNNTRAPRFAPPTIEDVKAYCRERGNKIDPEHFVAYYKANGWLQGRGKPVKDWRACVVTWEKNGIPNGKPAARNGHALEITPII